MSDIWAALAPIRIAHRARRVEQRLEEVIRYKPWQQQAVIEHTDEDIRAEVEERWRPTFEATYEARVADEIERTVALVLSRRLDDQPSEVMNRVDGTIRDRVEELWRPRYLVRVEEEDARQKARQRAAACAQVPKRYKWATFDAPALRQRVRPPSAVDKAKALLPECDATDWTRVVFTGPSGSGKTTLACCLLRGIVEASEYWIVDVHFRRSIDIANIRANSKLGSEPEELTVIRHAEFLVIDDLGLEPTDPTVIDLIHDRHQEDRLTVVTTGCSRADIDGKYGNGIMRRILGDGATVIKLGGKDG